MGIDAGVESSTAAFCVASRHYMATYCAALRFSPQIVMRGDRDSFVMLAGTWRSDNPLPGGDHHLITLGLLGGEARPPRSWALLLGGWRRPPMRRPRLLLIIATPGGSTPGWGVKASQQHQAHPRWGDVTSHEM